MEKQLNEKNLKWVTKDFVRVTLIFLLNALIILGIYIGEVYIECLTSGEIFVEAITQFSNPINYGLPMVLSISVLVLYFFFEDRNFIKNLVNFQMIFLMLELSLIVCFFLGKYVHFYLRPIAFPALLAMFLTNKKSAVVIEVVFSMLVLLMDKIVFNNANIDGYLSLIFGLVSGVVAIFCMGKVYSRLRLLVRGFLISIPTLICAGIIALQYNGEIVIPLVSALSSGLVSVACLILFLPFFEAIFGKVSFFKYSELTDHKSKLISKLIQEAPGTFNHSIVVSNIAEACATAIGEDAMLARTCAYYHDIGKLRRPEFFKENQVDGKNPHDDLTPELSTNIIKSHTLDGYTLVKKYRLPIEIADVCLQHHGTLPILFFYDKAKKFTDGDVDIRQFCYAGPKPQSKIAAIIMIADGCEAAARSLKDRSRANVMKVVRNIVDDRTKLGQFDECEITMKELNIIIHTVVNNLTGIYHNRIEYPKVDITGESLKGNG